MTTTVAPPSALAPLVEPGPDLTTDEVRRYSRHLLLPEIGRTGQRRLKNARVLVVGAGGLGSPVLLYLAAAGVGTIGLVDDDVVDESNLQRQIVHGTDDVGRLKVDSASDAIARVNPLVRVVPHAERLTAANALDVIGQYDLVLDGTDNFPTRYLVNDACVLAGKPLVWGSILQFDGQVSVFWAQHGPHYRDLFPEPPEPGTVPSCGEAGVLGVICASVGSVMATEAVKLITGAGRPLLGRLMLFDALAMTWRTVVVRPDPAGRPVTTLGDDESGEACDPTEGPVPTVSATELASMLERDEVLLVDVRQPDEYDIVNIPGTVLVPLDRIVSGEAFDELPRDRAMVLYCKSGVRSAQALLALRRAGYGDMSNLEGGVLAWVRDVDPSLPTY